MGWHQFSFLNPYWSSVSHGSCFYYFKIFIFLQIFLINISKKPEVAQTNYLYTWRTIECFHSIGPHANGIGPATISAAGVSSRVLTIRHKLAATALILPSDTWEYVMQSAEYCWLVLFTCQYTTWRYNYFTLFRCFKIVFWLFRIFS